MPSVFSTAGELCVTRLISATQTNPTMLQMLYYFSSLCANTPPLVETYEDGKPVTVIRAPVDSSKAPMIPDPFATHTPSSSPISQVQSDPPRRSPRFQPREATLRPSRPYNPLCLDIIPGTWFGCKGYKAILSTGEQVFAKLWDGWKYTPEQSNREIRIYNSLHPLWGKFIPRLIAYGGWGFCHIIVLELIHVHPLFPVNDLLMIGENIIRCSYYSTYRGERSSGI